MKKCIAAASLLLGIAAVPCIAQAQSYTVSLGNMTVFDGVSKGIFAKDSDYATVVAVGADRQQRAITGGPVELGRNDQYNWRLETDPVTVPANAASKLRIKYAVTNAGHTGNDQNKVRDELNTALMNRVPGGPGGPVAEIVGPITKAIIASGIRLLAPNCDGVLFAGIIEIDGALLVNGAGWEREPTDPSTWFKVVDYGGPDVNQGKGGFNGFIEVPSGCDNGAHYNLVVRFTKH